MATLVDTPEWDALRADADALQGASMRSLFEDKGRFERFSCEAAELFFDYSKNKITEDVLDHLIALAGAADLEGARSAMTSGEPINATEGRAVLHVALRDFAMRAYHVDGENVSHAVERERERMKKFADRIHSGAHKGFTGKPLTTIVNIGIGGSDLGPLMAVEALRPYWIEGRRAFFVSNVDGQHLADTLAQTDAETTLFIVASKTFTTQETMTNAQSARDWFCRKEEATATSPNILLLFQRMKMLLTLLVLIRRICSASGIGSVDGFPCGRRSGCRSRCRSVSIILKNFSGAPTPWTSISAPRPCARICRH